jgi:hypothetical protein
MFVSIATAEPARPDGYTHSDPDAAIYGAYDYSDAYSDFDANSDRDSDSDHHRDADGDSDDDH